MKNHKVKILVVWIFSLCGITTCYSQAGAPDWHRNPPVSASGKYCYISVFVTGNDDVLTKSLREAKSCLGLSSTGYSVVSGGGSNNSGSGSIEVNGRPLLFKRVKSVNVSGGQYVLMMFGENDKGKKLPKAPKFFAPLALTMSAVIPGTGQMYKKQKGKGYFFLFSTVLGAGATYYLHTEQLDFRSQFDQATTFEQRENSLKGIESYTNYRNIAAAATGLFYAWNIIDAVASKGNRYAFNQDKPIHWNLAFHPQTTTPIVGMTVSLGQFRFNKDQKW